MSGKKWRNSRSRFVQLPYRLLKSAAWHRLTPLERCAYIEIAQIFDGKNNGHLAVSARLLASLIPCSLNSAYQSLRALEDARFVDTVKLGKYARKDEERLASEYRLTEFRCDATGEPPSRRYNPQLCWDRSAPKPKRKALSSAERVRRYRKRCNACNDDRSSYENGIVPLIRTVNVTPFLKRSRPPLKTAKNGQHESANVTTIVPHIETHIHLTRGREIVDTPLRAKTGEKLTFGPSLAPGHSNCPSWDSTTLRLGRAGDPPCYDYNRVRAKPLAKPISHGSLTRELELELIHRYHQAGDLEALNRLVEAHRPIMAYFLAARPNPSKPAYLRKFTPHFKQEAPVALRRADRGFRAVPRLLVDTGIAWLANLNIGAMFRSFSGGQAP